MLKDLLFFEGRYFLRQPLIYIAIILFFIVGIVAGSTAGITFPNVHKNSPYEISYLAGILSLLGIFSSTIIIAQVILREMETRFDTILFASPVPKYIYLISRVSAIFIFSIAPLLMAIAGVFFGNLLSDLPADKIGEYRFINYLYPMIVLVIPNILLCVAVLCSTAWLTKNKLLIYVSGLFIFILYIIASIFSNSPLIAGATVSSPAKMALFAKLDPFGMAAFFEQTRYWTSHQRNTLQISFSGNFLFNRLFWMTISFAVLFLSYSKFSFRNVSLKSSRRQNDLPEIKTVVKEYKITCMETQTFRHNLSAVKSFIRLDFLSIIKGIPFILIVILITALLSMEILNSISGDVRSGAIYATSGLMISTIMETIPLFILLVLLFYSSELIWKSNAHRFAQLEMTTSVHPISIMISKIISLSVIPFFLVVYSIFIAICFQLMNGFRHIESRLYISLFYYTAYPLFLSTILITVLQTLIKNKYLGLTVASLFIFLTNSKMGTMLGIIHPLLRFGNPFIFFYGDMNGFGSYTTVFHFKMLFNTSLVCVLLIIITSVVYKRSGIYSGRMYKFLLIFFLLITAGTGTFIFYQANIKYPTMSGKQKNNWKQEYEANYKQYENFPNPTITQVTAKIDLYPRSQCYKVEGHYALINKTTKTIDSLLLNTNEEISLTSLNIHGASRKKDDSRFYHYWYILQKPMSPGDSLQMDFAFTSKWSPFKGHTPFNSIIENGTFIRISNYFPGFGYQPGNEITNSLERNKRKMQPQPQLKLLEAEVVQPYDYGFIGLDLTVSTEHDQVAVVSGDLIKQWNKNNRNYFHYVADRPIPFRFAISSARYKIKRNRYKNIPIEIYYDERHEVNVDKLIDDTKQTMAYCESEFTRYPHHVIRFAEISSFAEGFASTAYPSVIYMKENGGFYNDISDVNSNDVINKLAGHELSHQWWGSSQIAPEFKEGGWILSETLANYTALMLYRKTYGNEAAIEVVRQHLDIYLSNRSYSKEPPLYKTTYETPHLAYNKGLVVMYQVENLIGEKKVNQALSSLLKTYSFPNGPPTSQNLVDELKSVSPSELHSKIDELFKQVITYDIKLNEATLRMNKNKYTLFINAEVHKYEEDGYGNKKEIPLNEILEIGIYNSATNCQMQYFPIINNRITSTISLVEKPLRVILDPKLMMTDVFLKDNEKTLLLDK
ncbi:MAG: family transporter protein [Bacteroidota bacterium]|nr:family transporter protein [Bacteroidota bacterium]